MTALFAFGAVLAGVFLVVAVLRWRYDDGRTPEYEVYGGTLRAKPGQRTTE